jgi:Ca2+-binding RTX toxin-like protein
MRRLRWAGFVLGVATTVMVLGPAASATTVRGTTAGDVLAGTSTKDKIIGGGGPDVIFGRAGKDKISATPTGIGFTYVFGGSGRDQLKGTGGSSLLLMFDDDGQRGDVIKTAAPNTEIFSVDDAKDRITCKKGNSAIVFADGADTVKGCATVIRTSLRNLDSFGTSGADVITLNGLETFAFGGAGHDTITGTAASEFILGGSGADTIVGGGGDDLLVDDDGTAGDSLSDTGTGSIVSVDGAADTVNCQNAAIHVFVDSVDSTSNCGNATVTVFDPTGHLV